MDAVFYEQRTEEKNLTSDNPEMTALVDRVQRWTELAPGNRVLDFGCYDGYLLSRLVRRRPIVGVGVDIAESAARTARGLYGHEGLRFLVSDGALPFSTGSFDVVTCSEILEHVEDLEGLLGELARVLRPGGRMYATMPNHLGHVWPPLRGTCRLVDRVEGHVHRLTRDDFLAAGRRHGFRPVRSQYRGFLFSAVWYRIFIYSPRAKSHAMSLVESERSAVGRLARWAAYLAVHCYLAGDRLFRRSRRCMGIDAVFIRQDSPPAAGSS